MRKIILAFACCAALFGEQSVLAINANLNQLRADIDETRDGLEGVRSLLGGVSSQLNLLNKRVAALEESHKVNLKSQEINEKDIRDELAALKQSTQTLQNANAALIKGVNGTNSNLAASLARVSEGLAALAASVEAQEARTNATFAQHAARADALAAQTESLAAQNNAITAQSNAIAAQTNTLARAFDTLNASVETLATRQVIAADPKAQRVLAAVVLTPQEILQAADDAFTLKDFVKAREFYGKVTDFAPARAHFALGEIAFLRGDYVGAISHYQKSTRAEVKAEFAPMLLYHAGESYLRLGRVDDARRFFATLKARFPQSTEAANVPNF